MGRASFVNYLSPNEQVFVDSSIRRYRYTRIDAINFELQEQGINVSRSALWRYMTKLQMADGFRMDSSDSTIVTIMERDTGHVVVVKTSVRPDALLAHIQALTPPDPVS